MDAVDLELESVDLGFKAFDLELESVDLGFDAVDPLDDPVIVRP